MDEANTARLTRKHPSTGPAPLPGCGLQGLILPLSTRWRGTRSIRQDAKPGEAPRRCGLQPHEVRTPSKIENIRAVCSRTGSNAGAAFGVGKLSRRQWARRAKNGSRRLYAAAYTTLRLLLLLVGLMASASAPVTGQTAGANSVYVLTFDGPVTPVLERYILEGIDATQSAGAQALILRLDTPGGNVNVTKNITQAMLASPIPIAVYVAPTGATAGSAGTFVTLAGHVGAMTPGTSIGAASPVGAQGENIEETMAAKIENILSADIENLARRRGEDAVEWAISAVVDAEAATADEALALGVVDFVAVDVADLLEQMDGFTVDVNGQTRTLATAGAQQVPLDLSPIDRFLNFISDPTVASILLSLGILGLIAEIRTPGIGIPGVVGVICLLLAFYALGQLNANFVGLAFIALSVALFVAEAFTPTFGLFAVGGIICFILGAFLLFDDSEFGVPWPTIITLALAMGGFTIWAGAKAMAAQRRPVATGAEALIGATATVKEDFQTGRQGHVFVAGEWWNAELVEGQSAGEGDKVTVVARDGYTLKVAATNK